MMIKNYNIFCSSLLDLLEKLCRFYDDLEEKLIFSNKPPGAYSRIYGSGFIEAAW